MSAKYPLCRVETKVFSFPKHNMMANQENLFLGQLPKWIVIGMVENTTFNRDKNKNPYNFQHFDVNYLALHVDGKQIPAKPLIPKFDDKLCMRSYASLFMGTGFMGHDRGNYINPGSQILQVEARKRCSRDLFTSSGRATALIDRHFWYKFLQQSMTRLTNTACVITWLCTDSPLQDCCIVLLVTSKHPTHSKAGAVTVAESSCTHSFPHNDPMHGFADECVQYCSPPRRRAPV